MSEEELPQLGNANGAVKSTSSLEIELESSPTKSELSARTPTYRGINPFEGREIGCWDRFKMVFFVLTGIFFIRFITCIIFIILSWIFASLTVLCISEEDMKKPFSCWRKFFRLCVRGCMRVWLFCYGFWWISVTHSKRKRKKNKNASGRTSTGKHVPNVASNSNLMRDAGADHDIEKGNSKQESQTEAGGSPSANTNPYLQSHCIVSNHHTTFDGFILYYLYGSSTVMKAAIKSIPLTGTIAKAAQNIFVDRISRTGRKKAIKDIENHMCNYDLPPLCLFPQATCSNIYTLTTFKVGAFIPGLPVTPIALNYHGNRFTNLSFVGDSAVWEMVYSMCQFINFVTVHECDDYFPNEEERKDARLFASNVRDTMVARLESEKGVKITTTQHSLDDFLLIGKLGAHRDGASRANGAVFAPTAHIVIEDVTRTLQLKSKTVSYLASRFSHYDLNNDGVIDYDEFCRAFDLPQDSINMKKLFRLFNSKKRNLNVIGFEEYLAGVSICFVNDYIDDALRAMFDACNFSNEEDDVEKEYITYEWMTNVFKRRFDDTVPDTENDNDKEKEKEKEKEEKNDSKNENENEKKEKRKKFSMSKLNAMLKDVFETEDEKVDFQTFYDRMLPHYFETCQLFLQTVICDSFGIKLNPVK